MDTVKEMGKCHVHSRPRQVEYLSPPPPPPAVWPYRADVDALRDTIELVA